MADPTERYNKLTNEVEADVRRLAEGAEAQLPLYSRNAPELTRDEQRRDYLQARDTPGGFQLWLQQWRKQFGLKRAAFYFADWVRENERD